MFDNNSKENNVRLILAIALSSIIFFGYMFYQIKTTPPQTTTTEQAQSSENNTNTVENNNKITTDIKQDNLDTSIIASIIKADKKEAVLENDIVTATFRNGDLVSYKLKEYDELQKGKNALLTNKVDMVEQVYEGIYPFALSFQKLQDTLKSQNSINYYVESEDSKSVVFVALAKINNVAVKITKTFAITDKPYQLKNTVKIDNLDDTSLNLNYSYFLGTGIGPYRPYDEVNREDATKSQYLKTGKNTSGRLLDGMVIKPNIFSKLFGGGDAGKTNKFQYKTFEGDMKWAALNNRYFAIISDISKKDALLETATFSKARTNQFANDFHAANLVVSHNIAAKQSVVDEYNVFVGPKSRSIFSKDYEEQNYLALFQESFLGLNLRPLTYILDIILQKLYAFTKSYALAIILFTFLFKLITFPLTQASYKSMKKMQLMNPKIERLREQYKDNPEKMNAELMNIYKKEKINPLGGCLPMLLPFPLLIAFFYLMQSMVELRNSPFLWIQDLSSPDRLFIFPATLPILGGLNFNLIPILMAITSFLTMKLQPSSASAANSGTAKQMKMMNTIFPLMMLFMFYNFASGLALYWTAQNVFGLLQQFLTLQYEKIKGVNTVEVVETGKKAKNKKSK